MLSFIIIIIIIFFESYYYIFSKTSIKIKNWGLVLLVSPSLGADPEWSHKCSTSELIL